MNSLDRDYESALGRLSFLLTPDASDSDKQALRSAMDSLASCIVLKAAAHADCCNELWMAGETHPFSIKPAEDPNA